MSLKQLAGPAVVGSIALLTLNKFAVFDPGARPLLVVLAAAVVAGMVVLQLR